MPKPYNTDIRPGESDLHYYHRLAKVADQRLVRLEELAKQKGYESATQFSYARALRDIDVYNEGGTRFNTAPPEARSLMNEKIADMIHFINAPTSTAGGIKNIYQKRAKTINKRFGTNLSWDQLGRVMEAREGEGSGGSPTSVKAIGILQTISEDGLKKGLEKNKYLKDDVAMDVAMKYLKGEKFSDLREALGIGEQMQSDMLEALNLSKGQKISLKRRKAENLTEHERDLLQYL